MTRNQSWLAVVCAGACWALSLSGCYDSTQDVGGESHFLRPCKRQSECDDLGAGLSCTAGYCRDDASIADAAAATRGDTGTPGAASSSNETGTPGSGSFAGAVGTQLTAETPLVMILFDTSGSMGRKPGCKCEAPSCTNCLPDCARGEEDALTVALEVLTGAFDQFSCETIDRATDASGAYDSGYFLPYHKPSGTQRADGLLDQYRERLRFGLATFDGIDTYVGASRLVHLSAFEQATSRAEAGLWSYGAELGVGALTAGAPWPTGSFQYPNATDIYMMDTGIRSAEATEGALLVASDPQQALRINDQIQRSLLAVRPFGGTPTAAALDDLYMLFAQDPSMEALRAQPAPRHVILITDGEPDADYRDFGCNCAEEGDRSDSQRCGASPPNDPALMHCPYPTAEAAARTLRCGPDPDACAGPVTTVHVVSWTNYDGAAAVAHLDAIAQAGGSERARTADTILDLRAELDALLAQLAD